LDSLYGCVRALSGKSSSKDIRFKSLKTRQTARITHRIFPLSLKNPLNASLITALLTISAPSLLNTLPQPPQSIKHLFLKINGELFQFFIFYAHYYFPLPSNSTAQTSAGAACRG